MIRSMTGFGAAAASSESFRAAATVRSLNHRFLDVAIHLPRHLQPAEADLRRLIQSRIERGRVEVSIQVTSMAGKAGSVSVSPSLAAGVVAALRAIEADHGLAGSPSAAEVARFPGVLEIAEPVPEVEDAGRRDVAELLGRALEALLVMKAAEGRHLEAEIARLLDSVAAATDRIEVRSEASRSARREQLLEKLRVLAAELALDEGRLYQEVVRQVERQDVTEEIQRLRSHVAHARDLIGAEGPCGKSLDFLAQEMAREANTVGAKSSDAALVQELVGLKGEIEKLREQVHNVE
jgi:uncharacterized protein (TIGR00255 family)